MSLELNQRRNLLQSNGTTHQANGHLNETQTSGNGDEFLLGKAEALRKDLHEINIKFNNFLNEITHDKSLNKSLTNSREHDNTHKHRESATEMSDRVFIKRNSLLTDLFKTAHIRTIRHIFISIFVILILQVFCFDKIEKGVVDLNFDMLKWSFGKFNVVFYTWLYMKISTAFVVYYFFFLWSTNRLVYANKKVPNQASLYDYTFLALFICYMILFLAYPLMSVLNNKLPIASSMIVLCEQLRMTMKSYAFVRSNVPRALNYTPISNDEQQQQQSDIEDETSVATNLACPNFSNYLYFLFAPTLIYRDTHEYPRTINVRWNYVFFYFLQVICSIFYLYYIFQRFCIPVFRNFDKEHVTFMEYARSTLNCTLPATLILLLTFFAFLHCWLNAFAEMLRFGDRMFYTDWWNSASFSRYYRTWNMVVHDWLYIYVYKDLYNLFGKKNKNMCKLCIFLLSSLFHEYIIAFALGFFYPVMGVMFGCIGFLFMFIKPSRNADFWNFCFWFLFTIGLGLQMCLYSSEWYARLNCHPSYDSFLKDLLTPRSFICSDKNKTQLSTILHNTSSNHFEL